MLKIRLGINPAMKVKAVDQISYRLLSAWRKLNVYYHIVFKEQYGNIQETNDLSGGINLFKVISYKVEHGIESWLHQLFPSKIGTKENSMSNVLYLLFLGLSERNQISWMDTVKIVTNLSGLF